MEKSVTFVNLAVEQLVGSATITLGDVLIVVFPLISAWTKYNKYNMLTQCYTNVWHLNPLLVNSLQALKI